MKRVERHVVVKSDVNYAVIDDLCYKAKNLYNYSNYVIKRRLSNSGRFLSAFPLIRVFRRVDQVDYRSLENSDVGSQIIQQIEKEWKSYFKALKEYKKNPDKFRAKPKSPRYKKKNGRSIVIMSYMSAKLKDGYIHFPKKLDLQPIKTKVDNLKQVRIVPQKSCYVIEVVYEKAIEEHDLDDSLYLGIDLGVNNLATIVSNSDNSPLLLSGKILKSINQYYNKRKAQLLSALTKGMDSEKASKKISISTNRLRRLELKHRNLVDNYLHHTSRFIINYCLENKIKNIVIGYNAGWKQNINIGKVNNQKFVSIPFAKLIHQIKYKAEEVGITVQTVNEAYTSKCDAIALEEIGKHESYLGKRKKRGLFQSSVGRLVNADVNGALNILRKVIGNGFIENLLDRGCGIQPVVVSPLQRTPSIF